MGGSFRLEDKELQRYNREPSGKGDHEIRDPEEILTDQALEFNQGIAKEIYKELGIKKLSTTAYHPQTGGLVERYNAIIKAILAKLVSKHKKDWNQWIPTAMFVLRTIKQVSTGQTPHFILFGQEATDPAYLNYPGENSRRIISLDRRIQVHRGVKDALTKVAARSKERYDRVHTISDFRTGDWVLLYDKIPPSKFGKVWVGPFIINEVKGPLTVELEDSPKATLGRRHRIVNVSRIKAYKGRTLYEDKDVPRAQHRQIQGGDASEPESESSDEEIEENDDTEELEESDELGNEGESETPQEEAEEGGQIEEATAPQQKVEEPAKRRRRLIQEKMLDFITDIQYHSWNGAEYRFQVQWNSGREGEVGQERLSKGNPQERHLYNQYVRKNPGIASSLGGRMLHN